MKSMSQILAALVCAMAVTACGGGSKSPVVPPVVQPVFSTADVVVGSGDEADSGDLAVIQYKGYLYSYTAADHRGTLFDDSVARNATTTFTIGAGLSIPAGLDQGTGGMKVGGTRTVIMPSNLGFGTVDTKAPVLPGAAAGVDIPANSALIYDIALVSVKKAPPITTVPTPTALEIHEDVIGTGATVASGSKLLVHYTGWLFDGTKSDLKGAQFDTDLNAGVTTGFAFTVNDTVNPVIAGWNQGVIGMLAGGKRTLIIPASLAYGAAGQGAIPPNAALVFDIQVISVN